MIRLRLEFCSTNFLLELSRDLAAVKTWQVHRALLSLRSTWGGREFFNAVVYTRGCSEDPKLIGKRAVC